MTDFKIGRAVLLNGRISGFVEEIGPPEDMPRWKDWKGDGAVHKALLGLCRQLEITRCALIGVDGGKGAILIAEQRGQWRLMNDGTPLDIELVGTA